MRTRRCAKAGVKRRSGGVGSGRLRWSQIVAATFGSSASGSRSNLRRSAFGDARTGRAPWNLSAGRPLRAPPGFSPRPASFEPARWESPAWIFVLGRPPAELEGSGWEAEEVSAEAEDG